MRRLKTSSKVLQSVKDPLLNKFSCSQYRKPTGGPLTMALRKSLWNRRLTSLIFAIRYTTKFKIAISLNNFFSGRGESLTRRPAPTKLVAQLQTAIISFLHTFLNVLVGRVLVGAFRRKTQTTAVTFFKTNEVTDFISFIS